MHEPAELGSDCLDNHEWIGVGEASIFPSARGELYSNRPQWVVFSFSANIEMVITLEPCRSGRTGSEISHDRI